MTTQNILIRTETARVHRQDENAAATITGLALPFGEQSRNGNRYTTSSIKEKHGDLVGRPILWNHDADRPSLGQVTNTEIRSDGMHYEMDLDLEDDFVAEVARKIDRGDIRHVSIGALVQESNDDRGAVDIVDWRELTICNVPGYTQTTTKMGGETYMEAQAYFETLGKTRGHVDQEGKSHDRVREEPFAGYQDYDACVQSNQDKEDPDAYCAAIKRQVKAGEALYEATRIGRRVFGYAENEEGGYVPLIEVDDPEGVTNPCQDGYVMVGTKQQGGSTVPNCVPIETLGKTMQAVLEDIDFTPPESAVNNAQQALDWKEEHPSTAGSCGTRTGWSRATDIVNNNLGPVSVKKMSQFRRHQDNADVADGKEPYEDCGHVMWLAWGGETGVSWAERKVDEMERAASERGVLPINNDDGDSDMHGLEALSDVQQADVVSFVAGHFEGLSEEDLTEALGEAEFTGVQPELLAELLSKALDLSAGEVLELLEELLAQSGMGDDEEEPMEQSGDGEGMDYDDEEEEEEEEGEESLEDLRLENKELREKLSNALDRIDSRPQNNEVSVEDKTEKLHEAYDALIQR